MTYMTYFVRVSKMMITKEEGRKLLPCHAITHMTRKSQGWIIQTRKSTHGNVILFFSKGKSGQYGELLDVLFQFTLSVFG